jgi:hypothetical protein
VIGRLLDRLDWLSEAERRELLGKIADFALLAGTTTILALEAYVRVAERPATEPKA